MAQISVTINARQYRMACADGQEDHLTRLAADVDQRIQAMRNQFGEVGDMRLTIMGAITIADELADATQPDSLAGAGTHVDARCAASRGGTRAGRRSGLSRRYCIDRGADRKRNEEA